MRRWRRRKGGSIGLIRGFIRVLSCFLNGISDRNREETPAARDGESEAGTRDEKVG